MSEKRGLSKASRSSIDLACFVFAVLPGVLSLVFQPLIFKNRWSLGKRSFYSISTSSLPLVN